MNKKIERFLFVLFLLLIIALPLAAKDLEVDYPGVGGEDVSTSTTIGGYLVYLYNFAMAMAAIAGFVILIYAGFRYITSAGNPLIMKDAVSKITSAVIGLVLLLGIYLIIEFLWGQAPPDPIEPEPVSGIYLIKSDGEKVHYQGSVSNISKVFSQFEFVGPKEEIDSVFLYKQTDYQGTAFSQVDNDDGSHSLSEAQSLKIKFNRPGVYLKGSGLGEEVLLQHNVSDLTFTPQVTTVDVRNKKDPAIDWGDYYTVLHEKTLFEGGCQIISATTSDIHIQPESVSVFRKDNNPKAGAEIIVYPMPNYQDEYFPLQDETIEHEPYAPSQAKEPTLLPDRLQQNVKSIKVPPGYAAILFEENPSGSGDNIHTQKKCQIFYENNPDLDKESIGKCGGEQMAGINPSWQFPCATYIMIIPVE